MVSTPRCAPRRLGGPHTVFPGLNTPTETPQPRCHAGDQRVTMPALCLDEMRVHLFSQGKSGCSNLRLFAFGAGMAGVGEVALVEKRAASPTGRGGRPPGGGRGMRSGQGERSEQRPPQCREAQSQERQSSNQTQCCSDGGAGARSVDFDQYLENILFLSYLGVKLA